MKAAVYNRYWPSRGGGERHAGMLAQVLAESGVDVELIGHDPVDLPALADHLALDLAGCRLRTLPDRGEAALADVTADYDLWVTASYMSRLAPRARRSAYLCFFPTPSDAELSAPRRWLARRVAPALTEAATVSFGAGWFPPEGGRRRMWRWSSDEAVLAVPGGRDVRLHLAVGRPGAPEPTELEIVDLARRRRKTLPVTPRFRSVVLRLGQTAPGDELLFRSATFAPGGDDRRRLGVAASRVWVRGDGTDPRSWLGARLPWLTVDARDVAFLDAYDAVLANSAYTQEWVRRLWAVESDVLYPPIRIDELRPAGHREPAIVTVGRFFEPGTGHAKRQLEMVGWFGELVRSGRVAGWRMYVVGGCEPRHEPYLDRVRAAAAGLPVEVVANAPRERVVELLSRCAVFWSATGFGDSEQQPWAAEHFGMTTVEAMAGGCVPVVIDKAGQREIVRNGVDGYRWSTPEELAARTVELAGSPDRLARMSRTAVERARRFSDDAFRRRWKEIAARRQLLG